MLRRLVLSFRVKTLLAILWFGFTLALVAWWWFFSMKQTELKDSARRMFFWEGSSLIAFVIVGGGMLVFLTYRDERRHERLKFFFSNFTHDIKTSISRLQLQAEVLKEESKENPNEKQNPVFQRLVNDVSRLDLQLENSLWFANLEDSQFYIEKLSLVALIEKLKNDFENLKFKIEGNEVALFDRRALASVFRNLFQNALIHGKATEVNLKIEVQGSFVHVTLSDNGVGFQGEVLKLGNEILREQNGRGNGLGLMLSRRLMKRMKGDLRIFKSGSTSTSVEKTKGVSSSSSNGFKAEVILPRSRG